MADGIVAVANKYAELEMYHVYETDCLYLMCCLLGGTPRMRYYDIIHPMEDDGRSSEDVAFDRLDRFGIEVVD